MINILNDNDLGELYYVCKRFFLGGGYKITQEEYHDTTRANCSDAILFDTFDFISVSSDPGCTNRHKLCAEVPTDILRQYEVYAVSFSSFEQKREIHFILTDRRVFRLRIDHEIAWYKRAHSQLECIGFYNIHSNSNAEDSIPGEYTINKWFAKRQ